MVELQLSLSRQGDWDTEKLSNLPEATQLLSGGFGLDRGGLRPESTLNCCTVQPPGGGSEWAVWSEASLAAISFGALGLCHFLDYEVRPTSIFRYLLFCLGLLGFYTKVPSMVLVTNLACEPGFPLEEWRDGHAWEHLSPVSLSCFLAPFRLLLAKNQI